VNVIVASDRRFHRARVKPVRRRRLMSLWWLRLARALLVSGIVVYGGYRGALIAADAPGLRVDRIVVHGNNRLSNGEVVSLVEGIQGESLLRLDLEAWRRRLAASPWVQSSSIRRVLPGTVEIFVIERQPMGVARFGSDLYLIDASGIVVDEYGPRWVEFDLPIIDGLGKANRDGRPAVDSRRASLAARLLASLDRHPEVAGRISQIDVNDPRDAVVLLHEDRARLRLGEEQFLDRLVAYMELAPALRERVPRIDLVDLRFGERVYVRPAPPGPGTGKPPVRTSPLRPQPMAGVAEPTTGQMRSGGGG
jgi:cell division septal protein FtsQ